LTVGRLTLKETYTIGDSTNAQSGIRTITINGVETSPSLALVNLQAVAEDLVTMMGQTVAVTFSHKADRNGYYSIDDVNTSALHWNGEATAFNWSLGLTRIGPDNATNVESRLANVVRVNDFTLTGERWHAPAIGHYAYHTGSTLPTPLSRVGESGTVVVYRSIPAGVNPVWGSPVASLGGGRVRLLLSGIERAGTGIRAAGTGWELNNGLVKVVPGGDTFLISAWTGGVWRSKDWGVFVAASPIAVWDQMTVLRNDNECVTIRLLKAVSPVGRVMLDLTLRRGSRFVEGYLQRSAAADLMIRLNAAETAAAGTGYVTVSANDGFGNKLLAGSARTFTSAAGNPNVTRAAATTMDFFIGVELAGTAAVAGDQALNIRDQYIAVSSEATAVVLR
jgi:hypothetical protein